jgi:D-glycero-D-manno-heptose 1,7-bisphosphate phosphatase
MILEAARRHRINLAESWMVGDSPGDAEAGKAAGCRTILVGEKASPGLADFTFRDMGEFRSKIKDLLVKGELCL